MFFEDDPKALKEKEYGKVVKKQTAMGNQINILESNYHVL
jgi:hypothetical protein